MAFTVKTQAQLRGLILSRWASRYRDLGLELATAEDTEPYQLADALAFPLETLELRALQLTKEIFPDTASEAVLLKHADLIGLSRKSATKARIVVAVTGTIASSWTTANVLGTPDGLQFKPVAAGSLATSPQDVVVECQTAGTDGNKATGTVLTWSSAPSGINSTATVVVGSGSVLGTNQETIAALTERVLAWWRERPGAGNRADVQQWALSRSGVEKAFVYPLTSPTLGYSVPGTITIALLGAASVRSVSTPLGVNGANATDVRDYIVGEGVYAPTGQISCNVDPDDVAVVIPTATYTNVRLQVVPAAGQEFSFTGTFTSNVGSTTTRLELTTNPTGTILVGDWVAAPTGGVRGYCEARMVSAVGANYVDVSEPFAAAPVAAATVYPGAPWWNSLRDSIVALFDRLGPGNVDTLTYPKSARFPAVSVSEPETLYRSALTAVAMGVPGYTVNGSETSGVSGIVSATVIIPATDTTPAPLQVLVPNSIVFVA